jgi:hypothetical protein
MSGEFGALNGNVGLFAGKEMKRHNSLVDIDHFYKRDSK